MHVAVASSQHPEEVMGRGIVERWSVDVVNQDVGHSASQHELRRTVGHENADLIFENRPPLSATDSPRSSAY